MYILVSSIRIKHAIRTSTYILHIAAVLLLT